MTLLALPAELATRAYVQLWLAAAPGDPTPPAGDSGGGVSNPLDPVTPNSDNLGDVSTKATGLLGNLWWILLVFGAGYFLIGLSRITYNKGKGRYSDDDGNQAFITAVVRMIALSIASVLLGIVLKVAQ